MASIYSENFAALHGFVGTWTSPVVPANELVILRDLDVYQDAEAGCAVSLIGAAGQTIAVLGFTGAEAGTSKQWTGRQVIGPGQSWAVVATTNCDITVSGYHLFGP